MLLKLKAVLLTAALSLSLLGTASAFTNRECAFIAEQVYAAQGLLNEDKAEFEAVKKALTQAGPEGTGIPKEIFDKVMAIVGSLKQGPDPEKMGMAAFEVCRAPKV
jgi:hypothetical protein